MTKMEWYGDEKIKNVRAALPIAIKKACIIVEASAKEYSPVGVYAKGTGRVGGNLKGSITHTAGAESGRVGTNVDYAPHVEFGTRPHVIKVKNAKILSDGVSFFGKEVNHPGTAAQPFLRPAADKNRARVAREIGVIIGHAVEVGGKR